MNEDTRMERLSDDMLDVVTGGSEVRELDASINVYSADEIPDFDVVRETNKKKIEQGKTSKKKKKKKKVIKITIYDNE